MARRERIIGLEANSLKDDKHDSKRSKEALIPKETNRIITKYIINKYLIFKGDIIKAN